MTHDSKELPTFCTCDGEIHELGCPRAAPQPGMRAEGEAKREAISQEVRELLDDGEWPEYRTEDDRGLEHGEYVDLILQVLALLPPPPKPAPDAMRITEEERHAIGHARYQVERASPEKSDCCFHYDLVKDLLRVIDRSAPVPPPDGAAEAWPTSDRGTRSNPSADVDPNLFFVPPPPSDDVRSALADQIGAYLNDAAILPGSPSYTLLFKSMTTLRSAPVSAPATKKFKCCHCGEISDVEHDSYCGVC